MPNLILSRKPGETILLGDSITITFLEVVDGQVRVSIEAPREIHIRRRTKATSNRALPYSCGAVNSPGSHRKARSVGCLHSLPST
jgi:carbon storage regulator